MTKRIRAITVVAVTVVILLVVGGIFFWVGGMRPEPVPRTAKYDSAWKARFDAVYHLKPGQVLQYVQSPLIPERERFMAAKRTADDGKVRGPSNPDTHGGPVVIRTASDRIGYDCEISLFSPQFSYESQPLKSEGLTRILMLLDVYRLRTAGPWERTVVSESLEDILMPGDWVVRRDASQREVLDALAAVLREHTGRTVHFETIETSETSIVTQGAYAFVDDAFTPGDEGERDRTRIELYSDRLDDPRRQQIVDQNTLGGFLWNVGLTTGYKFIDETHSSDVRVRWALHESSYDRDKMTGRLSLERLDALLENLAKQTSLTFKHQMQPVTFIEAVELPEAD